MQEFASVVEPWMINPSIQIPRVKMFWSSEAGKTIDANYKGKPAGM
jgi:hypothetical protein